PSQVRDLLALVGDTSDNVPGVPGVGVKTAAELLLQFGSLAAMYEHLDQVKRQRIRENLAAHEADARLSQRLVRPYMDAPVDLDLEALRYAGADVARLRALFTELGFTRLLKSMKTPEASVKDTAYRTVLTEEALREAVAEAAAARRVAIVVHGTAAEPMFAD